MRRMLFICWLVLLAPVFSRAAENRVLHLHGEGDYLELPPNVLAGLEEATLEGWVKWNQAGFWSRFFDFGAPRMAVNFTQDQELDHVQVEVRTPEHELARVHAEQVLRFGEWMHVAVVLGASETVLYINGVLIGKTRPADLKGVAAEGKNYLGRNIWKESPDFDNPAGLPDLNGELDEVRLWGRIRTQEEIRRELGLRLAGSEPGLVALWNFDDGTARDGTGLGHDGILHGQARAERQPASSGCGSCARRPRAAERGGFNSWCPIRALE